MIESPLLLELRELSRARYTHILVRMQAKYSIEGHALILETRYNRVTVWQIEWVNAELIDVTRGRQACACMTPFHARPNAEV